MPRGTSFSTLPMKKIGWIRVKRTTKTSAVGRGYTKEQTATKDYNQFNGLVDVVRIDSKLAAEGRLPAGSVQILYPGHLPVKPDDLVHIDGQKFRVTYVERDFNQNAWSKLNAEPYTVADDGDNVRPNRPHGQVRGRGLDVGGRTP